MATRRFRIKAVANVSVSRGRCGEKPRENDKLDEKTSSNSSHSSDSQEVSPSETKLAESDMTSIGKLSGDSLSKETLENTLVHDVVKNSENFSQHTCLEVNANDISTPVETPSGVTYNITQFTGTTVDQESRLCDRTDDSITGSASEHSLKTEEIIESVKSDDSCVTSPQETDKPENIPAAPIRLQRKRMKPTVSLASVNRKVKENSTLPITQKCNSLDNTLKNNVTHPLTQNFGNVSEATTLEANDNNCTTPVDTASTVDQHLSRDPASANIQQSDDCDTRDVSLCNKTNENIIASADEVLSTAEESINSIRSEDSCATSAQTIGTTKTEIPAATIRLPRKRVKPTVSLSVINKKVNENNKVCHSVQNPANVSESTCLVETGSSHFTPVGATSAVTCNLTQAPGYEDIQQSDNFDTTDMSISNVTNEGITASGDEYCSKTEDSIDPLQSEDWCVTSAQKIDTTETKIQAAPIRLPRKRVKPAVSLSVISKKVKENLIVENTPACHSVQNSAIVSEPICFEETVNGCLTPLGATSVVSCNLVQDTGYADIQKSDNCDGKDVSICNRTNENIRASIGEHCSKTEENIDSVKSEDSFVTSSQKTDTTEAKIPAPPVRLPRKRVKPAVSLPLVTKKVHKNLTVENNSVCHSDQNSPDVSDSCLEVLGSDCSTPEDATSISTCILTQNPECDDIQQSGNSDSRGVSVCNKTNEHITASSNELCSKTEESIDSVISEDSSATGAQKTDTAKSKVPAAPIRLPRKRVRPAVSLTLVGKKVKENLTVENNSVCHSDQNSPNVVEPTCLGENDSDCSNPVDACNLTQDTGNADNHQSDNSDTRDVSICNKTNEHMTDSSGELCCKTEESIDSVRSDDSSATGAQQTEKAETKVPAVPIRLPRKRVKPAVSLSLVGKKVKENLTVETNPVCHPVPNSPDVTESTCLEVLRSGCSTPEDAASTGTCNLTQDSECDDIQQSDNSDSQNVSIGNRTSEDITASCGEHCSKTEENIDSDRSEDSCVSSAHKIDKTEIKMSAPSIILPRKRMKPTVSLSSVNKKGKENRMVQLTQHCSASRIDDNSTVQVRKKLQTSESSSKMHEDVEADCSGRNIPAVGSETPSSIDLWEVHKNNDSEVVPQKCVETHVLETTVRVSERKNEIPPDVISEDTPVQESVTSTVITSPSTCDSNVMNDSPVVGKDKGTSSPVKCPVNQLVKDCSPLNSFRSRFVRPKPLLESAARRNRTGSIGSASESDSEKKSVSSATTVSPPWKPTLKTSRNRLTHAHVMEPDKLANASSASTDESEDERSIISRAATISPPKKITRLDSYSGSDTSHSEFSQEVSEDNSSPVKKSTKPEWVSKRREYMRRIIEIKKEISHKVSDGRVNKSRLTMFDLIYYNPVTNPMKSAQETNGSKSTPAPRTSTENENRLAEESVDEPEGLEDEEQSSTAPVPQVKVGPNGEIILDEQSLVIETTDARKNWNDLQNSEVIMDYGNGTTTYNAYSKKRRTRTKDWNREETLRFYRALHTVGTDFLVMQSLFPKFTRKELKDRYKKEERVNRELVEKALRNPLTFDLTDLQKEFEQERLEEERRLTQPKNGGLPKRKGFRRSCSLFAALDSTDKGNKEKPVQKVCNKLKDLEETRNQKRRKTDDATAGSECKPNREETNSKKKRKTGDKRSTPKFTADGEETNNKKKGKAGDTRNPPEGAADRKETHSKKKRKTGDSKTTPECTADSEATQSKKKRKADDARAPSEHPPKSEAGNVLNGQADSESSVPEAVSQVKPTRSGRIPRPRIFEDFTTDDMEEIYEETQITEICERVTVEDICNPEPLGDELVEPGNVVVDEDTVATYESENEDQNFVIAEDALTVQQSQVNLGNVYSNVKPGTLIVLATESPDNPGHQIFRVFMVSNNSQTLPVSVPNNQALPAGANNSVEMNALTGPVVSESSTNDCNSLQMNAESSS